MGVLVIVIADVVGPPGLGRGATDWGGLLIEPDGLGSSCGCLPLFGVMGIVCDATGAIFVL